MILKEALFFILLIFSVFLLFSEIKSLKFFSFFLLFFLAFHFLKKGAKEDLRTAYHQSSKINLDDYLDKTTKKFLIETITHAEILKVSDFNLFLLRELLKTKEIKKLFLRLKVDLQQFKNQIKIKSHQEVKNYTVDCLPLLMQAFRLAQNLNYSHINLLLLFSALRDNPSLEAYFENFNIKREYLLSGVLMENFSQKLRFKKVPSFQPLALFHQKLTSKRLLNKALTSKPTNLLDTYGLDLTYLATKENAGFLVGHRKELESLINHLKLRNNVLLVGEDNSGRETIVLHLAWLIQNDLVPQELLDYRLVKLDLSYIYAENKEKFLPLLTKIVKEVIASGYIILYFPKFEQVVLETQTNIFQVLGEVLKSKAIPVIASITPLGYEKSLTKINLDAFFEKVEVKELSQEEALYLLTLKALLWEKQEKIIVSPQSIATAVILAHKFIKSNPLPKSAEDLLREAISLAQKAKAKVLTQEIIQELVFERTKIPVKELALEEKEKLLNLENLLHQRIVNQDYALKEIARVLRIYHAGLQKKKGPIGVFLFVGPTGVGKTETAKALAKIFYGSETSMIRLDMVEFQNPEDLEKLIGSKDGQILGRLTEPVRQNPYSLILLDEFEKTHPTIFKIFLPIFDEGIIKDALGREVDFSHSLIICTSNAYSEFIKENLEKGREFDKIRDELKSKLSQIFSVELLNRFDQVIVYKPLGEEELLKIAELLIKDLQAEVLLKHGIDLNVSEKALKEIVRLGTDPIFGARPLKRKIDEILKSEIANLILANKLNRGQKIFVDFDQEFKFLVI